MTTPPELRGRMMSLWLIGAAMHYIGAWPLGTVGEYWGWPMSLGGGAIAMLAFVACPGNNASDAAPTAGVRSVSSSEFQSVSVVSRRMVRQTDHDGRFGQGNRNA